MNSTSTSKTSDRPLVVLASNLGKVDAGQYFPRLCECADLTFVNPSQSEIVGPARERADVWVSRGDKIGHSELEQMKRCKLISVWGVGYDNIDVGAATQHHIPVAINPVFTQSMAEAGLALILALSKRIPILMQAARQGIRPTNEDRGIELAGRCVGLVGWGRIGRKLGEMAKALEMQVVAFDPLLPPQSFPDWCPSLPLDELLVKSDFVVITAPLTPQTFHLIGAQELARMKQSAYLINIARGPLLDEAALLSALQEQRIAGAGLDVWEKEPLDPANPLLAFENVIGTPHRLGATWESLENLCRSIEENTLRVLGGQSPLNVINPNVLEEK